MTSSVICPNQSSHPEISFAAVVLLYSITYYSLSLGTSNLELGTSNFRELPSAILVGWALQQNPVAPCGRLRVYFYPSSHSSELDAQPQKNKPGPKFSGPGFCCSEDEN